MQALRLNEVLSRVVAWHNRHPLAQRIQAGQVHSIGEVLLPFASAVAPVDSAVPAGLASVRGLRETPPTGLAAQAEPRPPADSSGLSAGLAAGLAAELAPVDAAATASGAAPPRATESTAAAAEIDDALDLALDLDMTPEAEVEAEIGAPGPLQDPFELAEADMAAADLAVAEQAAADLAAQTSPPPVPGDASHDPADLWLPLAEQQPGAPAIAAPAEPPPGWLGRLRARLAGRPARLRPLPRLQAAFSRNFIWPLSPARVARWARLHGQTAPVAPADWPRRRVEPDEPLRAAARQRGLHHAVHLHLLTAAIGVGDRRIRVLIGADGAVLGPRAYSRPRLAGAAGLLTVALLGSGWALLPPMPGAQADRMAAAVLGAAAPASAPKDAASAPDAVAAAPLPAESAASGSHSPATPQALDPASLPAVANTETDTDNDANAAAAAPPAALAAAADTASAPIARIRPVLSGDERQAARQQAATLRATPIGHEPPAVAAPPVAQTAPVYAVVTRARRQHQSAVQDLALLRSASKRLSGAAPAHGELVQNQGEWRAAWWPFVNLADAERARVLLAGRGLKAEVVAF